MGLPLFAEITTWLTPIWILSVGVAIGVVILAVLYGLTRIAIPRIAELVVDSLKAGVMSLVLGEAVLLALFAVVLWRTMPVDRIFDSVRRIHAVGPIEATVKVPPRTQKMEIDFGFRSEELKRFVVSSDQDLVIGYASDVTKYPVALTLEAPETKVWDGSRDDKEQDQTNPFHGTVNTLFATNLSDAEATLDLNFLTGVEYPEVYSVPISAAATVGLFLFYFAIRLLAPKVSVIAATTARQAVNQPLFYLSLAIGVVMIGFSIYIPYHTLGEDVKMVELAGLSTILILAVLVSVWTASLSVAEEIEGRTALTLLSKPVGRRQFVFGKFLGVIWPALVLFLILGLILLITVSFKTVYDAREGAKEAPNWQMCYAEMIRIVPGLALAFMETVLLAAISVAISTRLPMLANLTICASVYVMGHLVPLIAASAVGQFPIVRFVGNLVATIFPVLDHYSMEAAIVSDTPVPPMYLVAALGYTAVYCTIAMLLALLLFEDRDLA